MKDIYTSKKILTQIALNLHVMAEASNKWKRLLIASLSPPLTPPHQLNETQFKYDQHQFPNEFNTQELIE